MVLLEKVLLLDRDSEERRVIAGVTWKGYKSLLAQRGDRLLYRVAYLDGDLEIVAPSRRHESQKTLIGNLLEIYFLETDIPYFPMGSTTLKNRVKSAGVEPDESYCVGENKEIPDLAIEVVVTSGSIDRLELYGRLGIREVWFWRKEELSVYVLQEMGGYEKVNRSEVLPDLDLDLLQKCAKNLDPLVAVKQFRRRLQGREK